MSEKELSLDLSVLYRLNQKYYDKALMKYSLGYTQMVFILMVFENEGSNFNELTKIGCFDKGTVTKSIAKLAEMGFVTIENSKEDKRNKEIYTTDKAKNIIYDLYKIKNDWFSFISSNLKDEEIEIYKKATSLLIDAARERTDMDHSLDAIKFYRFDKVSFSAYLNHASCVLYTGGCKFRCKTCNYKDLVFLNENLKEIKHDEIFDYLQTRKNLIDSVVIKGTDPIDKDGLSDFLIDLKNLNLQVKLETNGFNTNKIKELVEDKLIDCLSISIHSSKDSYADAVGLNEVDLSSLNKTIRYLLDADVDYEYLITTSEIINEEIIENIGKWLKGSKRVILKNFERTSNSIDESLNGAKEDVINRYQEILNKYVEEVKVI